MAIPLQLLVEIREWKYLGLYMLKETIYTCKSIRIQRLCQKIKNPIRSGNIICQNFMINQLKRGFFIEAAGRGRSAVKSCPANAGIGEIRLSPRAICPIEGMVHFSVLWSELIRRLTMNKPDEGKRQSKL